MVLKKIQPNTLYMKQIINRIQINRTQIADSRDESDCIKRMSCGKVSSMNWIILILAGLFECGWAICLKYTDGFTRLWPTIGTVFSMVISLVLLGIAMKSLPVGTAYAVWVGVGAVGTAILGIVLLGEPANIGRVLSLALILAGIIGLKLSTQA